jgi:hypothetical protein
MAKAIWAAAILLTATIGAAAREPAAAPAARKANARQSLAPPAAPLPVAPSPPEIAYAPDRAAQPDAPETYPIEAPVGNQLDAVRSYAPSLLMVYPAPHYDCYSYGHHRLDCYPSFCERHYRRPYNYRVEFDYPWHADVYGVNNDGYIGGGGECLTVDEQARGGALPLGRQVQAKTRTIDLNARANAALAAAPGTRPAHAPDAPAVARRELVAPAQRTFMR